MSSRPPSDQRHDPIATRAIIVSGTLLALIVIVFILGKTGQWLNIQGLQETLADFASSAWGLPLLIAVFCIGAFFGLPQFALIAMAVFAFGPLLGFFYAWIANQVSGAVTFWVGRFVGEEAFQRYAGRTANRLSRFIGRNAFAASAIIRNVPSGPFLLVNMAFGVSQAKFWHYMAGLAVGSLPKLALVAFAGQSLFAALKGHPVLAVMAGLVAVALYVLIALYARTRMRRPRQSVPLIDKNEVDSHADGTE